MTHNSRKSGIGHGIRPLRSDGYIDEIAVERACKGDHVRLTAEERAAVVAKLTGSGYSAIEIALRLRVAPRVVQRYRTVQRTRQEAS